jgi:hypothetical protein
MSAEILAPQDLVSAKGYAGRDNSRLVNDDSGSSVKDANIHSQHVQYPREFAGDAVDSPRRPLESLDIPMES